MDSDPHAVRNSRRTRPKRLSWAKRRAFRTCSVRQGWTWRPCVPSACNGGRPRPERLPLRAARPGHPGRPAAGASQQRQHAHNIHAVPQQNREFNRALQLAAMKHTHTFSTKEVMVPFKCDVHKWMNAYVGVLDHPFYAVTAANGRFELKGLPPGTYQSRRGTKSSARRHKWSRSARNRPATSRLISRASGTQVLYAIGRTLDRRAHLCRRAGDEHGVGVIRPGLAEHLWLVHVHIPARKDGGWDSLRAFTV